MTQHTKRRFLKTAIIAATVFSLTACAHTAQYTSGQDYLSRYQDSPNTLPGGATELDKELRSIASVEPELLFPARIGLARIEQGRLSTVPASEQFAWQDLREELNPDFGEFVPVNPMIANMVKQTPTYNDAGKVTYAASNDVVSDIRRGSARQHLDYVLIYEVNAIDKKTKNALALSDLSVLGLWVLPSRKIKVQATASAILIDVRNGYPYGQATAYADKAGVATAIGSGDKRRSKTEAAKTTAVQSLTGDIKNLMDELYITSLKSRVAKFAYR